MSDNSLASLLAWLKEGSQMLGWGMILAVERDKANILLLQEYMTRFRDSSYLKPVSGSVLTDDNQWRVGLHSVVLDAPRLSFENADVSRSKAMLSMDIISGDWVTEESTNTGWPIQRMDYFDPLQKGRLSLVMSLPEVPVNIDASGTLFLDLKDSDEFLISISSANPDINRHAGTAFKILFNDLPDAKRIYPLAVLEAANQGTLRPTGFALRTQASPTASRQPGAASYGNGAILALGRMGSDPSGNFPDDKYRYLVPDDPGKNYSSTVLFDRQKMLPILGLEQRLFEQVASLVSFELSESNFTLQRDTSGRLVKAIAKDTGHLAVLGDSAQTGEYQFTDHPYKVSVTIGSANMLVRPGTGSPAYTLEATGPESYQLNWALTLDHTVWFQASSAIAYFTSTAHATVSVSANYTLRTVGESIAWVISAPIISVAATLDNIESHFNGWGVGANILRLEVERKARDSVTHPIQAMLAGRIHGNVDFNRRITEWLALNFGQTVPKQTLAFPYDLAGFGGTRDGVTSFEVTPREIVLPPSLATPFLTEPRMQDVTWSLANIDTDPDAFLGEITPTGLYAPPAATQIKGAHTRVRVVATAGELTSSALVTVVSQGLSLNPIVATCEARSPDEPDSLAVDVVELAAGTLVPNETLEWKILNEKEGESGRLDSKPDGSRIYTAHPRVAGKTYIVDEVEVYDPVNRYRASTVILAKQKAAQLKVHIAFVDLVANTAQLVVRLANDNEVPAPERITYTRGPHTPGSVDQGLYTPGDAPAPYALILCSVPGPGGNWEGHIIIPLPLSKYPEELILMTWPLPAG